MNKQITYIKAESTIDGQPVITKHGFIEDNSEQSFLRAINSACNRLMRRFGITKDEVAQKFTLSKNDVKMEWPEFEYKKIIHAEDYEKEESGRYLKYPLTLKKCLT